MRVKNQSGSASGSLVTILLAMGMLLAIAAAVFAFFKMQDYKTNTDKKIEIAVIKAKEEQKKDSEADFAELAKQPYKTFKGPNDYGAITFLYPKTWNLLNEDTSQAEPIRAYFNPEYIPSINGRNKLALTVAVTKDSYDQVIPQYNGKITSGKLKALAYIPPQMVGKTNVLPGLRLEGELGANKKGVIVVVPVGERTLTLTTEDTVYVGEINNILNSLTFIP